MANRVISDLFATALNYFQIGISSTALRLKNVSGVLRVRNKADNADAAIVASKLSASGDDLELNEGAAGSGSDYLYTLRRPSSGMSADVVLVLPVDNGSPAQALLTDGDGNLYFGTVAGGDDKTVVDTTTVGFGASSPVAMFTKPANAVSMLARIIVDTAFDGTPSMSIGISGNTSKFVPSTAIDLTTTGIYEYDMSDVAAVGSTEAVIATYSAGGASVGSARILFEYSIPS